MQGQGPVPSWPAESFARGGKQSPKETAEDVEDVRLRGNVSIHEAETINGVLNPVASFQGTYTVAPTDCTFTATLPPFPEPGFVGVFVGHGKQLRTMLAVPGYRSTTSPR